ncbi:hypothetical protein ACFCYH_29095 [Streptomyces sp. NPDC056400]|uniref:hypothetical protein n=1 Tax=unclassified Streptomyces TaxID=2593676 RepID=UPI0035D8A820
MRHASPPPPSATPRPALLDSVAFGASYDFVEHYPERLTTPSGERGTWGHGHGGIDNDLRAEK